MKILSFVVLTSFWVPMASAKSPDANVGLYLSIGNPYPTPLGINFGYHLTPGFRLGLGYGEVSHTEQVLTKGRYTQESRTVGEAIVLSGDFIFSEQTDARPTVGLKLSRLNYHQPRDARSSSRHFDSTYAYTSIGLDYLDSIGFYLGTGLNVAVIGASGANFYLNTGYFY